jgi:hypothetical protein
VDALLLSAGVNDLGFSHLIKHCAFDGTDTDCWHHSGEDAGGADPETDVEDKLAELPARYDNLAKTIKAKLHPARTYIAQYPVRLFTDEDDRHGGCGFASAINEDEAAEFTRHGETLNQAIANAADANHWTAVPVTEPFRHHGYCADGDTPDGVTWFRSWSGSRKLQGDNLGTAHPRFLGHDAVAKLVKAAIGHL